MELASIPAKRFHSIITDAQIDAELNKNEPDNQPIDFFEKSSFASILACSSSSSSVPNWERVSIDGVSIASCPDNKPVRINSGRNCFIKTILHTTCPKYQ
jgi:hypothetical protein